MNKILEETKNEKLESGFLPLNEEYNETSRSPMEIVEENPKRYIIEECIPACKELWRKNIYTFMVSDHLNEGECWIEIILDNLSDENKLVLEQLNGEDVIKFSYHKGCINFGVNKVGLEAQIRLLELAKQFKMQDVPKDEAYITVEEFLIKRGCYSEIINPNYIYMEYPFEKVFSTIEEQIEHNRKYSEWERSDKSKRTIIQFDEKKQNKPLKEYLNESGARLESEKVYLSNYHYQKHINYINYLKQMEAGKKYVFYL